MFPHLSINVSKLYPKSVFVTFLIDICDNVSWRCFTFLTKKCLKSVKKSCLDSFLSHFWREICYFLNTFFILIVFCSIFSKYLMHFCHNLTFDSFMTEFWQFFDTILCFDWFWQIFDTFLSVFCHIFEMVGPTLYKSTETFDLTNTQPLYNDSSTCTKTC